MRLSNLSFLFSFLLFCLFFTSCLGQEKNELSTDEKISPPELIGPFSQPEAHADPALNINVYVHDVIEDRHGNFWFATYGRGAIRSDGEQLEYFEKAEGMGGKVVRSIEEDKDGNLWFATEGGLTKYDGNTFINYTTENGLPHNEVWSLEIDKTGIIWAGTLNGLSRFDGELFSSFELPNVEADKGRYTPAEKLVRNIMEDRQGKLWFATDGGAFIYDGKNTTNISEKDGLPDNSVNDILEDKNGNIWFATHNEGVCRYDGNKFEKIKTRKGSKEKDNAWHLYEDKDGNIWFPIEGAAVFKYNGEKVEELFEKQSCVSHTMYCTYEDKKGRIWFVGWLGVYRMEA